MYFLNRFKNITIIWRKMSEKSYSILSVNTMISSGILIFILQLMISYNIINLNHILRNISSYEIVLTIFTINTLSLLYITSSIYYLLGNELSITNRIEKILENLSRKSNNNSLQGRILTWLLSDGNNGVDLYRWSYRNIGKFSLILVTLIYVFNIVKYLQVANNVFNLELLIKLTISPHSLLELFTYYIMIAFTVKYRDNPSRIIKMLVISILLLFAAAFIEVYVSPMLL